MKKLYFIILTMLLIGGAKSQTYSGQLIAGGNLTFRSEKHQSISSEYSINIFSLSPSAGVFVVNNLAAGFRLDYSRYRSKSSLIEQRSVIQLFSYSPFIRYYFLRPSNKINVFVDGSYNFVQEFITFGNQKSRTPGDGFTFSGGPVLFISESIAIEFALGYKNLKFYSQSDRESTIFSSIGFQLHFANLKKNKK